MQTKASLVREIGVNCPEVYWDDDVAKLFVPPSFLSSERCHVRLNHANRLIIGGRPCAVARCMPRFCPSINADEGPTCAERRIHQG